MSIFVGNQGEITDIQAGTTPVQAVYRGTDLVWQRVTTVYELLAGNVTPADAADWVPQANVNISGNNPNFLIATITALTTDPKFSLDLNNYCTPGQDYQIDFDYQVNGANQWQWGTAQNDNDNTFTDAGTAFTGTGSATPLIFTHNNTTTRYFKFRGVLTFTVVDSLQWINIIIKTV